MTVVAFMHHETGTLTLELKWPQAKLIPNLQEKNSELESSFTRFKYNPIYHMLDTFYRNDYCHLRSKHFKCAKTVAIVY